MRQTRESLFFRMGAGFLVILLLAGCTGVPKSERGEMQAIHPEPIHPSLPEETSESENVYHPASSVIVDAWLAGVRDADELVQLQVLEKCCENEYKNTSNFGVHEEILVVLIVDKAAFADLVYRNSCGGPCGIDELAEKIQVLESEDRNNLLEEVRIETPKNAEMVNGVSGLSIIRSRQVSSNRLELIVGAFEQPPASLSLVPLHDKDQEGNQTAYPTVDFYGQ